MIVSAFSGIRLWEILLVIDAVELFSVALVVQNIELGRFWVKK